MITRRVRQLTAKAFLPLVLLSFTAGTAYSQCGSLSGPSTSWTASGTGSFTTSANWDAAHPHVRPKHLHHERHRWDSDRRQSDQYSRPGQQPAGWRQQHAECG